ncbi:MAG: chitobiase/beta-hexosaminidase C-terminal domain-containing protein [Chthoniobacterales bacterium]
MKLKIFAYVAVIALFAGSALAATVEAPMFSPGSGTYFDFVDVTMTTNTTGATIFFTTDGTDPDMMSDVYDPTFPPEIFETTVVKAFAYKPGDTDSTITTATYTIVPSPPPTLKLIGKKSIKTLKSLVKIRGISTGAEEVDYSIDDGDYKTAKGVSAWSIKEKLKPGKHQITVYAVGEFDDSEPLIIKVTVLKKK